MNKGHSPRFRSLRIFLSMPVRKGIGEGSLPVASRLFVC